MKPKRFFIALLVLSFMFSASLVRAQDEKKPAAKEFPEPRAKDGKKLLTALDLMKLANVSAPRISPDGSRIVYAVSETRMEKDKEWKNVTQQGAQPFIDAVERYVALVSRMADKIRSIMRQDNKLSSDLKDVVEQFADPESAHVPSCVDLDQAVERFCAIHNIAVPTNVDSRMRLHVQAIEEWIKHSSSHQGGAHDGEG